MSASASSNPIVSTEYGKIEGFVCENEETRFKAEVFLGIPFAKPPIGELRFEKPQPPSPWSTTLQAKKYGFRAATYNTIPLPNSSEDCLTLNVMKPSASEFPNASPFPVMVFIHGGAFIFGSSADFKYTEIIDRLVARGVIVVTINYRLGPYGFFSTGDSDAPGNYGLWDQVEALKFIQKTISAFQGDPKNVTIFGASAGGAATSWLTLSPAAKGLFARALIMCGSPFAAWASSEEVIKNSMLLAKEAGCVGKNLKEQMKAKTVEEIEKAALSFVKSMIQGDEINFGYFYPRLDGDFVKEKTVEAAIANSPKTTNFVGISSQENAGFILKNPMFEVVSDYVPMPIEKAENFTQADFIETVEKIVATEKYFGPAWKEVAAKIIAFYESQKSNYTKNFYIQILTQLFSDLTFNIPAMREAIQKASHGHEVYFYFYDYMPEKFRALMKMELFEGAPHGSDCGNILGPMSVFPAPDQTDLEVQKVKKMQLDLFVSFAQNGIPKCDGIVVGKVPSNSSSLPYIHIGTETSMKGNLWPERLQFWDNLSKEFGFDLSKLVKVDGTQNKL